MTKSRMWLSGGALAAFVALIIGWLFVVSPQRAKAVELNSQADQIVAANVTLNAQIIQLKRDFANLPATQAKLDQYAKRIPATAELSAFLRQLSEAANASHVTVTAISPTTPSVLTGKGQSVMASAVSISVTGHYAAAEAFLTRIELLQRAFLVTGLSIAKGGSNAGSSSTGAPTTATDPKLLQVTVLGRIFIAVAAGTSTTSSSGAGQATGTSGKIS
jgi:Tfp pilus assembly protein PilO